MLVAGDFDLLVGQAFQNVLGVPLRCINFLHETVTIVISLEATSASMGRANKKPSGSPQFRLKVYVLV